MTIISVKVIATRGMIVFHRHIHKITKLKKLFFYYKNNYNKIIIFIKLIVKLQQIK